MARRRGKSVAAIADHINECATTPNVPCIYLAQTGSGAESVADFIAKIVLADCPPEMMPRQEEGRFVWENGSTFEWFGTDSKQYRRRRGRAAKRVLYDECGFYESLEDVEGVYGSMIRDTGGTGLYLTSAPESPAHTSVQRYRAAQANGRSEHATVWDNPRYTDEYVRRYILQPEAEQRGMTPEQFERSTYWRREYMAEIVAEESRQVVPTWTEAAAAELVGEWERPQFFDAYESFDIGGLGVGDPSAVLFGFYDPATSTVTIEDEIEVRGLIDDFVGDWKAKESGLWGVSRWEGTLLGAGEYLRGLDDVPEFLRRAISENAPRQPYLRVGDTNAALVLGELATKYGVAVLPTAKHDLHKAIDDVAEGVARRRLRIHRRCRRLIEQLFTTLWNRQRSQFERTAKDHGDLVAALIYLWRNVRWHRDCRPPPASVEASSDWRPPKPRNKFAALTRRII